MAGGIRKVLKGKKTVRVSDLFEIKDYFNSNIVGNRIFRWKIQVYKTRAGRTASNPSLYGAARMPGIGSIISETPTRNF
jgi:hypothetical protein